MSHDWTDIVAEEYEARVEHEREQAEKKAEIDEVRAEMLRAITLAGQAPLAPCAPSLNTLYDQHADKWYATVEPITRKNHDRRWNKHIREGLGKTPIHEITENAVQALFAKSALGKDQQKKLKQQLKRVSKEAIKAGHITHCPFEDVKVAKERHKDTRPRYWHPTKEIPRIFEACDEEQRDAFGTLYYGFCRSQDAKHLQWEHVHFGNNTIAYARAKSGRFEVIPMLPYLATLLRARMERLGVSSGLVFPSPRGGAFGHSYDWHLDEVLSRAGVPKNGRRLHAYRHAAAVAAASGVFGKRFTKDQVGAFLRDTSNAVDVYFQILAEDLQELAQSCAPVNTSGESSVLESQYQSDELLETIREVRAGQAELRHLLLSLLARL